MLSRLRALLILILVVLFGHGPFAWGHSHADLDARQLEQHLRLHHADDCSDALPHDWHAHLTWICSPYPALTAAGSAMQASGPSPSDQIAAICQQSITTIALCQPGTARDSLRQPTRQSASTVAEAARQQELYQRLAVLLI